LTLIFTTLCHGSSQRKKWVDHSLGPKHNTGNMKLPHDVKEFFRKQGKIGGKKRHANLSPERRKEIAKLAAEKRWAKAKLSPTKKTNKGAK